MTDPKQFMARCESRPCGWFSRWYSKPQTALEAGMQHWVKHEHQVTVNEA